MQRNKKDSTTVNVTVCAIVFCLFSFIYIYCYQGTTLAFAQNVLSGGKTVYMPLVSASMITAILFAVQRLVFMRTHLSTASHALTYMPSMIVLACITNIYPDGAGGIDVGIWVWMLPLVVGVFLLLIMAARQWISAPHVENGLLSSHSMMVSLSVMMVMMLCVSISGNGKHLFHQRVKAEQHIIDHDYAAAAKIGENTFTSDITMTYLSFLAMDKLGILADNAFTHPVVGGSASLLHGENVEFYLLPKWTLRLRKSKDYRLCTLLADCNLDAFARNVVKHYAINDSLPQHYKEALILYQHQRSYPVTAYTNAAMETDYKDMQQALKAARSREEQLFILRRTYKNTYWAYFMQKN